MPIPRGDALHATRLDAGRSRALQAMVKTLPRSAAPMEGRDATSPFGERTDLFNGRAAFHPGIDLAATLRHADLCDGRWAW